ncbi:hypothetical protein BKG59_05640 [Mycobacteroides chelonae]|nr:hypothetical protein BKG63_24070 [Mycobacteroides chelonae]OHT99552.1 hypothetical protein BKG72_03740 [Mycobacteroides chelonae]OLT92915.1 hypothetical protein BKG59_05640 [Mycobacteroides chelonae]
MPVGYLVGQRLPMTDYQDTELPSPEEVELAYQYIGWAYESCWQTAQDMWRERYGDKPNFVVDAPDGGLLNAMIYLRAAISAIEKRTIPETVTRVDVIAPKRKEYWSDHWAVSIQDDGRTLKLFAEGDGASAKEEHDIAFAKCISEDLRKLG